MPAGVAQQAPSLEHVSSHHDGDGCVVVECRQHPDCGDDDVRDHENREARQGESSIVASRSESAGHLLACNGVHGPPERVVAWVGGPEFPDELRRMAMAEAELLQRAVGTGTSVGNVENGSMLTMVSAPKAVGGKVSVWALVSLRAQPMQLRLYLSDFLNPLFCSLIA